MKDEEPKVLHRPCTLDEFNMAYKFKKRSSTTLEEALRRYYSKCSILSSVLSLFPAIIWLHKYKWTYLTSDLVAGFTVAVIHIPQGMAYAALGAVHPIVGVYMAIFPVLVYVLMGTSHHISMGSFSIVCLMAGKPILMYSTLTNTTESPPEDNRAIYSPAQVASVVCMTVGMLQVFLSICKFGSLSMFMSASLMSGFTTGAAFVVLTSQLKHAFGVQLPRHFGIFSVIHTYVDLFYAIPKTNYIALTMSLSVVFILLIYTDFIKPMLGGKILFPIELIVIVLGSALSYLFSINDRFSIKIVGSIPTGFPSPIVPPMELIPSILVDSIVIAIVSFSINISMATIFAARDNYSIDANQEFLACGLGNMFGAIFSCLPMSVSLSRSMVQYLSGGKTQLASAFSSLFLLSIILYFGKFLEPLPYAVLAGIVIACLKSVLMQVKNLPGIWTMSTTDGMSWLITFLAVVLLSVEIGLGIALTLAVLSIILMNQKPEVSLLGKVPNTDIFLVTDNYPSAKPVPKFIILKINGGLHFANIHLCINKIKQLVTEAEAADDTLVLDMSSVVFIDPAALRSIHTFIKEFKKQYISVCFAQCTGQVYQQMKKCSFFSELLENDLFPTIQDAVQYATLRQNL